MKNKKSLFLVRINSDYCNFLRRYDTKIYYNDKEKELRPFIGTLFNVDEILYFAPLTSPKPKHKTMKNSIDFYKIDSGRLGAINFNNMLPVNKKDINYIDLNKECITKSEKTYQGILKKQVYWLNRHRENFELRAENLYLKYKNNTLNSNIKDRCCNFPLLEEKGLEYRRVKELLPILKYIKDEENLYYIYDNLENKELFEDFTKYLDCEEIADKILISDIKKAEKSYIENVYESENANTDDEEEDER